MRAAPVLIAALLLAACAPAVSQGGAAPAGLSGSLAQPSALTLEAVSALPAKTVSLEYTVAGQATKHSFTGALLIDVLKAARPSFRPEIKNDSLRYSVLATGRDGYSALFSWGELDPDFGNRGVLIAYAQDGQPLSAADGPLRLVVPGDGKGGRYVSGLASVQLLRVGP
ncbi:molybdopterin-dependent oxidoreductase [Deinococcus sp.]|uniref:molybdopterin-dependent oxidoreductase n=1 Tax=Deinococcus sp. TaxID=47478 RepID=UPI003CC5EE45